ncbi:MAG: hypothetical protein R2847_03510 [Bacteroidia bacterium]
MFHALAGTNGGIYIFCTGNSPFTYAWSSGAVSQDLVVWRQVLIPLLLQITQTVRLLFQNDYSTNCYCCNTYPTNATCGQNNGSITTSVSGYSNLYLSMEYGCYYY